MKTFPDGHPFFFLVTFQGGLFEAIKISRCLSMGKAKKSDFAYAIVSSPPALSLLSRVLLYLLLLWMGI